MKKVTAFVGSAHKKNTHKAVVQFLNNLQALGDVEYEIVTLSDYKLGVCRGCRLCFEKGEEFCPLKDDRDVLMDKIAASDGVIFATPNYTFQMSGIMKTFLDRFGFAMSPAALLREGLHQHRHPGLYGRQRDRQDTSISSAGSWDSTR